jgi:hypothetical protein
MIADTITGMKKALKREADREFCALLLSAIFALGIPLVEHTLYALHRTAVA